MRTSLLVSFVAHGSAVLLLALVGVSAPRTALARPLSVSIVNDGPRDVERPPEPPPLPSQPLLLDRWDLPEGAPAPAEIEAPADAPAEIDVTGGLLPRPARLAKALRHRAPAPASAATAAPVALPLTRHASGKLEPPRLLAEFSPSARYPERARRAGIEGDVLLLLHVGADGAVGGVEVVRSSGHADLDRAATEAASAWRFDPARRDGKRVAQDVRVPFEFRLADA